MAFTKQTWGNLMASGKAVSVHSPFRNEMPRNFYYYPQCSNEMHFLKFNIKSE